MHFLKSKATRAFCPHAPPKMYCKQYIELIIKTNLARAWCPHAFPRINCRQGMLPTVTRAYYPRALPIGSFFLKFSKIIKTQLPFFNAYVLCQTLKFSAAGQLMHHFYSDNLTTVMMTWST